MREREKERERERERVGEVKARLASVEANNSSKVMIVFLTKGSK